MNYNNQKLCENCFEKIENTSYYSRTCKYCKYNGVIYKYYVVSLFITLLIIAIVFLVNLFATV